MRRKILLIKPPYFTPWTPPLGIAILKSFLEQHGHPTTCVDFNTDPELWGMHHKYFAALQALESVSINDGYSKLWWILNAHMLAYANGADPLACSDVLRTIIPMYGIKHNDMAIATLIPLVDRFFRRLGERINQLDLSDFVAAGTSTYTTSLAASLFILGRIKRKHPSIKTVMGGGVFADDLALGSDNLDTLINEYPWVDHVILGEGELLLLSLLQGAFANQRVISITDIGEKTLDMSRVPAPDFSDFDLRNYYHLTIEGARSCPFQCKFCSETIQWGDYRKRPMASFAEQVIRLAQTYGNNTYFMGDSLMNPYISAFSNELLKREARILYDGYLRADKPAADRDRVKLWARAGLYRVRLGLESASARVLKAMDKMTTPDTISKVLKALASAGVRPTTYWIVGFPGETEADFRETLDFIREHHRYIYELEAHPYYYYPYGQVGSRLYPCYSLYPEAVTRIIKFKVWDIVDADPIRAERYERLRRVSQLAAGLGLPNIYSMAERYQAEDRWHRLHPLAREVYEGTPVRKPAPPPSRPLGVFSDEWWAPADKVTLRSDAVLCYRASVNKRLDKNTLAAAVDQLIQYNEMLQMRLHGESYVLTPEHVTDQGHKTSLMSFRERPSEQAAPRMTGRVLEEWASDMRPEPGASVQVVLIHGEEPPCQVILLVHRAIADAKSVVLLLEDLFRLYEQLSNGRDVSLPAVLKTYADFMNARTAGASSDAESPPSATPPASEASKLRPTVGHKAAALITRTLAQDLAGRIISGVLGEYDLTPTELLVAALLRSLTKAGRAIAGVDIRFDHRSADASLARTVGPLTRIHRLSLETVQTIGLLSRVQEVRGALRDLLFGRVGPKPAQDDQRSGTEGPLLLDLEYMVDEPWLGGDDWTPQGFLLDKERLSGAYRLEIAPVRLKDGLQLRFMSASAGMETFIEELSSHWGRELASILDHCEHYVAAKRFWLAEFKNYEPPPLSEPGGPRALDGGSASARCPIRYLVPERMGGLYEAEASAVTLAAYGVLLSRFSGREDLMLMCSFAENGRVTAVPIRLYPSWDLGFQEFVRTVKQKIALALENEAYMVDILSHEMPALGTHSASPTFDFGYMFRASTGEQEVQNPGDRPAWHQKVYRDVGLVLEVTKNDGSLSMNLWHQSDRFGQGAVEKLGPYLESILHEVTRKTDLRLGEIASDGDPESHNITRALSTEEFHFC